MIASLSQKIEIGFWDMVIVMLTNSQLIRKLIAWGIQTYQNEVLMKKIALGVVIACGGFATGILAFTIASLI
jgi:hypothetical protein